MCSNSCLRHTFCEIRSLVIQIYAEEEYDLLLYLRLLLDTGATDTAIRAPCAISTTKFCLMGQDFGPQPIIPIDLHSCSDCDGFFDVEFLLEYSIFIDY